MARVQPFYDPSLKVLAGSCRTKGMPVRTAEQDKTILAECEATIERCKLAFVDFGFALYRIQLDRLWSYGYKSFEQYCRERWGLSKSWSYDLMHAAHAHSRLTDVKMGNISPLSGRLLPKLTSDVKSVAALCYVPDEAMPALLEELEREPKLDSSIVRKRAAKYLPPKPEPTKKSKTTEAKPPDYHAQQLALVDAAELLAELAEARQWTYDLDQRLGATIQSLGIARRKLRGMIG